MTPPLRTRHWQHRPEPWALSQVANSHVDTLYLLGELSMLCLMWHPDDLLAGLVDHCPTCFLGHERTASAYQQPNRERCPTCFGTSFEGGFRAQIIRPTLWTDSVLDTREQPRGEVDTDTMGVETTADVTVRHGDYLFRLGGRRYRVQETTGAWLRTGLGTPDPDEQVSRTVGQARLEEVSSVAYLIPPTTAGLDAVLHGATTSHLPPDLSAAETVRGPLVL